MQWQGVTDIDWRDVALERKIGAGAFGNVYKGALLLAASARQLASQPALVRHGMLGCTAACARTLVPQFFDSLCLLAATWKGKAVAVKVMLASHGEHAGELESFRQEVRPLGCELFFLIQDMRRTWRQSN